MRKNLRIHKHIIDNIIWMRWFIEMKMVCQQYVKLSGLVWMPDAKLNLTDLSKGNRIQKQYKYMEYKFHIKNIANSGGKKKTIKLLENRGYLL